ncbi:MAG: RHS repeat-associated core domain-containing protein [Bacteroidota bacterium]|nr:RHS repeat-associated core domain-containing protein [Bacteroidota bacterium]
MLKSPFEEKGQGVRKWSLGSWAYEWNANGSLHKIKRADGKVFTFKYDAFGRRISKKYLRREFFYIWDKNVPLHEIQKEELCEDNIITWIFEGFTPTAKLINGKAYSIISDHIGTPLMAIDTQGNKVWERELDIYGKVRKEFTSDDVANRRCGFMPFLYAGQYYDKETDLAYNRFRYYSPDTGSYISQDPIGLLGNNPTLYGYVYSVVNEIDIFGLNPLRNNLIKAGQGIDNTSWQAHHLIPNEIWKQNEKFFNNIGFAGQHEATNGIALPNTQQGAIQEGYAYYHNGSHSEYSDKIKVRVDKIKNKYNDNIKRGMNPNQASNQAVKELQDLQKMSHRLLNRKTKSNTCNRVS